MRIPSLQNFRIRELLLISLALHLLAIGFPSDGSKVFDEAFYVPAANDILQGKGSNPEHPFLGKLWGAIGIAIFGNNWFGWRIPMVAFGILALYVFFNLAKFFLDERKALVATAFLSFDTIFFMHSSLLLLDVPPLLFAFLGFYLYLKDRYLLSAASFGMAILSKEWAVLFVLALVIYHLVARRPLHLKGVNITKQMLVKTGLFVLVLTMVVLIPMAAYTAAYKPTTEVEVQVNITKVVNEKGEVISTSTTTVTAYKNPLTNPLDQIRYMLDYQSKLTIKNDNKTTFWNNYAWGWIMPDGEKPPIYFESTVKHDIITNIDHQTVKKEIIEKNPVSWKGVGNFPLWLSIWLIAPFAAINIIKKPTKLDYLIIAWIAATFLPWFYVSGVTHRIVYAFYFVNVVPILALGIPHFIAGISNGNLKLEKLITAVWLGVAIIFFLYYFPVNVFDFG